jgi:hypothetical protein
LGRIWPRSPESIKSPAWHEEILDERRQQIADGNARFDDWETAKVEIRNKVSSIFILDHKAKQLTCTFGRSCFDTPTQITPGLCLFRAEFCGIANS